MVNLIQLFPPYLIIFTLGLVIFPTIIVCGIRVELYNHLVDASQKVSRLLTKNPHGQQPSIVRKLEDRFRRASLHLEYVNTSALLDGIYSEETFTFLPYSLRCEQWDYFSRILPNLLLAFGLLGTFLGITLNLTNISSIIHQGSINDSNLVESLQNPLQSMGIAFFTSLIALVCSSFLTLINLKYNTGLAKNKLINSLEDYLDNVYHPEIMGDTRLDKAVNRMVEQQHDFLMRFHEKVGDVLESTLKPVAQQIANENEKANRIAIQIYETFREASGTLSNGATIFERSTKGFEQQVTRLIEIVNSAQETAQTLEKGALIFKIASEKIEQSKFSENLENLTENLAITQEKFTDSTIQLSQHIGAIIESNTRANDLAERVYTSFTESTTKIQDSALGFLEAADKIEQSQFADKLSNATQDLAIAHHQFAESTLSLNQSTQLITALLQELQNSIQQMMSLGDQISNVNEKSVDLLEFSQKRLESEEEGLHKIQSELVQLVETVKTSQQQSTSDIQSFSHNLSNILQSQLIEYINQLQNISQTIEQSSDRLELNYNELSKIQDVISQNSQALNESIKSWVTGLVEVMIKENSKEKQRIQEITENVLSSFNANNQKFNSSLKSLVDDLADILSKENSKSKREIKEIAELLDKTFKKLTHMESIKSNLNQLIEIQQRSLDQSVKNGNHRGFN